MGDHAEDDVGDDDDDVGDGGGVNSASIIAHRFGSALSSFATRVAAILHIPGRGGADAGAGAGAGAGVGAVVGSGGVVFGGGGVAVGSGGSRVAGIGGHCTSGLLHREVRMKT